MYLPELRSFHVGYLHVIRDSLLRLPFFFFSCSSFNLGTCFHLSQVANAPRTWYFITRWPGRLLDTCTYSKMAIVLLHFPTLCRYKNPILQHIFTSTTQSHIRILPQKPRPCFQSLGDLRQPFLLYLGNDSCIGNGFEAVRGGSIVRVI